MVDYWTPQNQDDFEAFKWFQSLVTSNKSRIWALFKYIPILYTTYDKLSKQVIS